MIKTMATHGTTLLILLVLYIDSSLAYSKYGRTCTDIGCPSNQVCVMAEDPCYRRGEPCGSYPTCEKKSNAVASCATFVCPPTMHCRMDGDTPKCISDGGPIGGGSNGNPYANVDIHGNRNEDDRPSAPIYPQVPARGQTTTRAPIYRPNNNYGGGYQGGSIGSGYPGQQQPSNNYPGYPSNGNGYSGGSIGGGYPGGYSGYPGQNHNNNNRNPYGSNQGGHSGHSGYPNYPYQGSNTHYNTNRYGSAGSTSNPLYDSLTDTLKSLGVFCILLLHARLREQV